MNQPALARGPEQAAAGAPRAAGKAVRQLIDEMSGLRAVGQRYNATPGEIAIAWTLRNPAVTGAIIGVRSAQQVSGIAGAADVPLGVEDMLDIEQALTPQAA